MQSAAWALTFSAPKYRSRIVWPSADTKGCRPPRGSSGSPLAARRLRQAPDSMQALSNTQDLMRGKCNAYSPELRIADVLRQGCQMGYAGS